jgi:hypothetical protein
MPGPKRWGTNAAQLDVTPSLREILKAKFAEQPVVQVSFWAKPPKSRLGTKDLACDFWANRPKLCYCHGP